jgi:hypothetical protein
MKNKIILGILSDDTYNGKDEFLALVSRHGFSIHTISSKIEEMAKYLLKINDSSDITQEDIDIIRKRGYAVNKLYWLNILLTSVSEKEDRIIIKDLWVDDIYESYVLPVVSDPILVPNIKFVLFPKNSSSLREWMREIEEKMYNTK